MTNTDTDITVEATPTIIDAVQGVETVFEALTSTDTDTAVAVVEAAPVLTRDEMRAKIFSSKPKTEIVEDFYGVRLELRQPSLAVALETRNQAETEYVFTMLLDYSYVPGTNEKVFEDTDVEMIRELPFGSAMTDLLAKVNKLLGIDGAAIEEMLKDATKSAEG